MEINEFDCFSMQSPQSFAFGKIQLPLLRGAFQIVKFRFIEPIYYTNQKRSDRAVTPFCAISFN